jgi:hypothetical protein
LSVIDELNQVRLTSVFGIKRLDVIHDFRDPLLVSNLFLCQPANFVLKENGLVPHYIVLTHHVPDLKRDQLLDFIILFHYIVAGYLKRIFFMPFHLDFVSFAKFVESFSKKALILLKHGL